MNAPVRSVVEGFYDARVAEKLLDFTHPLPRIEAAIETLADWAPPNPRRVLEIGCGVGATSWRMARAWPQAEVIGVDISPGSIAVADTCFHRPNLSYRAGTLDEWDLDGTFDVILMMDVYEHIPPADRPKLHALLRARLSPRARFVMMAPTPAHQNYLRECMPEGLQPVDEDLHPADVLGLASDIGARVLYYREVGIWRYGDYFHAVLGRSQEMPHVAAREFRPPPSLKQTFKRLLRRSSPCSPKGASDFLGPDMLVRPNHSARSRFEIGSAERASVAAAWTRRQ